MSVPHQKLLEGPIIRSLLSLAIPIALANILQAAYQLIDAYWVGRLGGTAVAAVSVSTPVMFLTIGLGAGLALAGSTLIAQYFGARNQEMVDHVAGQTLLMIVVVSIVLGTAGFIFAPTLLRLMGVAPDVYPGALGFMRVSFVGLVFNFFFFMFQSIMRGIGEAKLPVFIVLGTVILNFVLDPPFIFGWGPIPAQGVKGAALATLATQSLAAVVGLAVLFSGRFAIHLGWRHFIPDFAYMKRAEQIGRLGAWLGFAILSVFGVIAFLFAPQLVAFFVPKDPDVIAHGATYVRIMALAWGFLGAQFSLTGVLRASGNMVETMVLTLVSQWVLQFPLAYVLSKHTDMGERGIWWAFPVTNVIIVLVTLAVYAKGDWKRKRLMEPGSAEEDAVTNEIIANEGVRQ